MSVDEVYRRRTIDCVLRRHSAVYPSNVDPETSFDWRATQKLIVTSRSDDVGQHAIYGSLSCRFHKRPTRALIVKRPLSPDVAVAAAGIARFLTEKKNIEVYVERDDIGQLESLGVSDVKVFDHESATRPQLDLVVAMGGDGTILWASRLFPGTVPPVISIFMGSLGYLAQFPSSGMEDVLDSVINKEFNVQLRNRIRAQVYDQSKNLIADYTAMNDCVFERGSCAQLTALDVYCNDRFFTTVTADGLIIATPSGSTAYSMSSGGSMVHPQVPCMLFTPICPHSLSFRPVVLPNYFTLKVLNRPTARASAWLSVDGKQRTEISNSMFVIVSMCAAPLPLVVKNDTKDPWLTSLKRILNWNYRIRYQLPPPGYTHDARNADEDADSEHLTPPLHPKSRGTYA